LATRWKAELVALWFKASSRERWPHARAPPEHSGVGGGGEQRRMAEQNDKGAPADRSAPGGLTCECLALFEEEWSELYAT